MDTNEIQEIKESLARIEALLQNLPDVQAITLTQAQYEFWRDRFSGGFPHQPKDIWEDGEVIKRKNQSR